MFSWGERADAAPRGGRSLSLGIDERMDAEREKPATAGSGRALLRRDSPLLPLRAQLSSKSYLYRLIVL